MNHCFIFFGIERALALLAMSRRERDGPFDSLWLMRFNGTLASL